ncbi:hypothetical protein HK100_008651, partial [Physocladia obscura]
MTPKTNASGKKNKKAPMQAKHTTVSQHKAILIWLEEPNNFKLITGSAYFNKAVVGNKLKKTDTYKSLASFVSRLTSAGWTVIKGRATMTHILDEDQPEFIVVEEGVKAGGQEDGLFASLEEARNLEKSSHVIKSVDCNYSSGKQSDFGLTAL